MEIGNHHPLIGITGGIGAGKSVVCRILRLRGLGVYDCDSRARGLMQSDPDIVDALDSRYGATVVGRIGPCCDRPDDAGRDGSSDSCSGPIAVIDRAALARIIFRSEEERLWVNALVHEAVRRDVVAWHRDSDKNIFVESAILCESRLALLCSQIWLVDAPVEIREQRALSRRISAEPGAGTNLQHQQIESFRKDIMSRIRSQETELAALFSLDIPVRRISNVPCQSVLSQIPSAFISR